LAVLPNNLKLQFLAMKKEGSGKGDCMATGQVEMSCMSNAG